jgi:hypothetical protein
MKSRYVRMSCLALAFLYCGTSFAGTPFLPKKRGKSKSFDIENLSLGGGLSYTAYPGSGNSLGINLSGHYNLTDKNSLVIGGSYGLPTKITTTVYGNAYSSMTSPDQIEIPATFSYKFHSLYLQFERYFWTTNDDNFGFYGTLGAGLLLIPSGKATYGTYDQTNYYISGGTDAPGAGGFFIRGGLGVQFKLGSVIGFSELKLDIPATQVNGQDVEVSIPVGFGLNAGVRYPFGK